MSALSLVAYAAGRLCRRQAALAHLMRAHRYRSSSTLSKLVALELRRRPGAIARFVEPISATKLDLAMRRSLVLKMPARTRAGLEKGVIVLTFTETSALFHYHVDCAALLRYFYVVLEPSWAGYCDANLLHWTQYAPEPVILQATEDRDGRFLEALGANLVPVPFGSSDWVDFRVFRPLPGLAKRYDVVYVTNYNPIKRHHVLFRAIAALGDRSYRAALVFGKWGSAKAEVQDLIDHYGVRANVDIFDGLAQTDVNTILNMSKVNVLLSRKEGSNRSIFEGFFADTPGIVLRRNIGVRKSYLNDRTGTLVEEAELPRALAHFRTEFRRYEPRAWALEHISPIKTTEKLAECVRGLAHARGEAWTTGLATKVNAPEVAYFDSGEGDGLPSSAAVLSIFRQRTGDKDAPRRIEQELAALGPAGSTAP